jgi:putative membrane protein
MKLKTSLIVMFALPLALSAACGTDDDTTNDNGGRGGTANGGRAGSAASAGRGGSTIGGAAGETSPNGGSTDIAGSGGTGDVAGAGESGEGGAGGTAGAVAALNDAQILKALSTANQGEVSVAQVAKPALQNAAAVSFAQMMIDEHGAANGLTLALVSAKHLAPEPSDVSASLERDTTSVIATLSVTAAAAFDKAYLDSQISMHEQVLGLIDSRLAPDASDADVKALLVTLRASVAAHLTEAQTIRATLH